MVKFVYSEKATKFCELSTLLSTVHTGKIKVGILQNFVAFSEYMNFTVNYLGFLLFIFALKFYMINVSYAYFLSFGSSRYQSLYYIHRHIFGI